MDGNYGGTLEYRIQKADVIIFLYLSTITCLFSVIKRIISKVRVDVIPGCMERFEWGFIKFTIGYNKEVAPKVLKLLSKYNSEKIIHIFKSRRESDTHYYRFRFIW